MGYREMFEVRASGLTDRTQVDVLEALAFFKNEKTGKCFPSTEALARVSRVNPNLVRKTIRDLVNAGLVSYVQEPGKPRYFTLNLGKLPKGVDESEPLKDREGVPLDESKGVEETTPLEDRKGDPLRKVKGTPLVSSSTPLEVPKAEQGREQGREQGKFFVESPSGGSDDAPPTLFDDETTEKVERSASRIPACPYQKLVDLYHEVCPMLPTITVLTPGRKTQLKARWTEIYREEHCTSEAECLENFRFIFNRVAASRFLTGRTDPGPGRSRPFVANLDWLIKAANFVKVCENRYSN